MNESMNESIYKQINEIMNVAVIQLLLKLEGRIPDLGR